MQLLAHFIYAKSKLCSMRKNISSVQCLIAKSHCKERKQLSKSFLSTSMIYCKRAKNFCQLFLLLPGSFRLCYHENKLIGGIDMKRLYRSSDERMICGVCGGIAEYLNIDPTIVRLLWLILLHFGFAAYIICCLVIPEKPFVE